MQSNQSVPKRTPPEPGPGPVNDPPDPLENPDIPVREPDPDDPPLDE